MKCQKCHECEAVIHYIEIDEDKKTSLWICEECAREEGISADEDETEPVEPGELTGPGDTATGFEAFLGGMLETGDEPAPQLSAEPEVVCPGCTYRYEQLQETHLLGCAECYTTFRSRLLPMLRRYHSEVGHVGKAPRADGPRAALRRELAALKVDLNEAIAREDYETAAGLRDEIRRKEADLARGGDANATDGSSTQDGG